jgi:hypothetical protein
MAAVAQYTILTLMVITFVSFIVFPNQIFKILNFKEIEDNNSNEIHNKSQSWKEKISFKTKLIITAIVIMLLGIFFFFITKENKNQQKKAIISSDKPEPCKIFAANATSSMKKYQEQTMTTTQIELEKLKNNPKYQEMLRQKGSDKKNWVWQTAEKEKKTVWKDDGESSNSEGLSEI